MATTTTTIKKRLIVCCDGTWMDSDTQHQHPSNVTRIARAITPLGRDTSNNNAPIPQIVFYQNGVGTGSKSLYVKYVGGATGEGLASNIREAYAFLCLNYVSGDEIFLLGFSRGAFTARSISTLIRSLGLLTPLGLESFAAIFEDWQHQLDPEFSTSYPDVPWPGHKGPVDGEVYQRELLKRELTRPNIPVKAVAVWDTVGSLGVPLVGLLPQPPNREFAFVDTKVEGNIEYAFQALALDERRRAYAPTVWERPTTSGATKEGEEGQCPRVLKQTWFPGVHSDVGGSYRDTGLANLTLCWMVGQLEGLVDFDEGYLWRLVREGIALEAEPTKDETDGGGGGGGGANGLGGVGVKRGSFIPRPWGLGKIHDSMTPFYRLGGEKIRTPGEYRVADRGDQHGTLWWMASHIGRRLFSRLGFFAPPKEMPRLSETGESFHSSVRIRMGKGGKGYGDKGLYESEALVGWSMSGDASDPSTPYALARPGAAGAVKNVTWRKDLSSSSSSSSATSTKPANGISDAHQNGTSNGTSTNITTNGKTSPSSSSEVIELPEDPLSPFEKKILNLWPEIADDFDAVTPGGHVLEVRKGITFPPRGSLKGRRVESELPPLPPVGENGVAGGDGQRRIGDLEMGLGGADGVGGGAGAAGGAVGPRGLSLDTRVGEGTERVKADTA